ARAETFGSFVMGAEVQREGERTSIDGEVEAMDGKLHLDGGSTAPDRWSVNASLQHPSFNRLVRLASPSYRPRGGELGPVKLAGRRAWTPAGIEAKELALGVGDMTLGGDLQIQLGQRPVLTGTLKLGDLALDKFLPARQAASLNDALPDPLRPGV